MSARNVPRPLRPVSNPGISPVPLTKKRSNISNACDTCRDRRTRCPGGSPCATCSAYGTECIYTFSDKRRTVERSRPVHVLQARVNELEAKVKLLTQGLNESAAEGHRQSDTTDEPASEQAGSASRPPTQDSDLSPDSWREDDQIDSPPDIPHVAVETYNTSSLPPETDIRNGSKFFFDVISGLFFVITRDDFTAMSQRVYQSRSIASLADIVELCALAAVGTHYDPGGSSSHVQETMFRTALQHVYELIELDALRAIRCIVCLAAYGIIEKLHSTRALVRLGLQLTRWNALEEHLGHDGLASRTRLDRTLVLFECWLVTSLGFHHDLKIEEIQSAMGSGPPSSDITDLTTQLITSRAALLKVQALQVSYGPGDFSIPAVNPVAKSLESWYNELPASMSLHSLVSNSSDLQSVTASQSGALLLGHAMYLGSIIMLYRPSLAALTDQKLGIHWHLREVTESQAKEHSDTCTGAARTIVQIFMFLEFGTASSGMHIRCWCSVFEIYTACVILIASNAIALLDRDAEIEITSDDLQRAGSCLEMLEASAKIDPASAKVYERIHSIHVLLSDLSSSLPSQGQRPTSASREPSEIREEKGREEGYQERARVILAQTAQVLRDPFGHDRTMLMKLNPKGGRAPCTDWWT